MSEKQRSYLPQDERRVQLLEAGLQLFGRNSYEDVSIDDIAESADVSKGLIYHYFRGKKAFYNGVVTLAAQRLVETLQPEPELDGPENLVRGLRAYFRFVGRRADAYLALMHGGLGVDDAVEVVLEKTRADIARSIIEVLGAEETPALRTALRAWIGGVESAALDWLAHGDVDCDELIRIMTASLVGQLAVTLDPEVLRPLFDMSLLSHLFETYAGSEGGPDGSVASD